MLKKSFTNSKVLKIMLYTLIILGITCFNAFPKSSARYIKEPQDYVLAFENNLINLHENTAFTPEQFSLGSESNYEDFIANLSFKRNNVIFDNTKEIYTIKLAESVKNICEITSITSKDYSTGTPVNIGKIAGNTITYDTPSSPSYNEESTTRIEAFIKCKVNDITIIKGNEKYINLPNIEIKEEIVGEGSFTYLKGGYEEILSKYIAEHPMRDEDLTFEINKIKEGELRNLYEEILNWFDAHYYPYTEYYNEINKYLSNYINESTINIEKLKGLDIDASNLDYYIIKVTDNFVGYARTNYLNNNMFVYFSSEKSKDINDAFDYYLTEYYGLEGQDKQDVLDYINAKSENQGISYFVLNNNELDGFVKTRDSIAPYYQFLVDIETIKNNALTYKNSQNEPPIISGPSLESPSLTEPKEEEKTPTPEESGDEKPTNPSEPPIEEPTINYSEKIYNYLITNYQDILSENYAKTLSEDTLFKPYIANISKEEPLTFNDYYILYEPEKNYYLILNLSNLEGESNLKLNILTNLLATPISNNITISFTNIEAHLTINLTKELENPSDEMAMLEIKNEMQEIIAALNNYFQTEITIADEDFILNENILSVTYNLSKITNISE